MERDISYTVLTENHPYEDVLPDVKALFDSGNTQTFSNIHVSKQIIIQAQQEDETLVSARQRAAENAEPCHGSGFFYKDGLLFRKYRPLTIPAYEEWAQVTQVVAPKTYQAMIMELAHNRMSRHLGVNKNSEKILRHFYWPRLRKDVSKFIKSCHVCQVSGKPNQKIPPVPLQPIPVIKEPFSRVIIDCVGPFPNNTNKGNQYLLTVMCTTTRFPEAVL